MREISELTDSTLYAKSKINKITVYLSGTTVVGEVGFVGNALISYKEHDQSEKITWVAIPTQNGYDITLTNQLGHTEYFLGTVVDLGREVASACYQWIEKRKQ